MANFAYFLNMIFGGYTYSKDDSVKLDDNDIVIHYVSLFLCLFCAMNWQQTKWIEIRFKTSHMEDKPSHQRYNEYFNIRLQEDEEALVIQEILTSSNSELKKKLLKHEKHFKKSTKSKAERFDSGRKKTFKKAGSTLSSQLPFIVLWVSRINMFVLTYLYHHYFSFIHLIWIIFSFMVPSSVLFLTSAVVMVPILSWEFTMIYGNKISTFKENVPLYQRFGP